ncbi:class I SAM-dependent methyltransferase [Vibrio kyushuensis]|uniref:class I SAM-dependent methyltransferase n=1 Tax=Vibrio kyushuensis TaxID=2910249 RepID=UPI003D12A4F9
MSEMYTKHAQKYGDVVRDNIYNAYLERPSTLALLDNVKGMNIIDMGCGSGIYSEWFIKQSASQVTCVDKSPDMVALVESNLAEFVLQGTVKTYAQDLSKGLPVEASDSADVIVCPLVLHYIEDLDVVFKDVHRVLKSGGYMVFSTHHPFADFECTLSGNYFDRELIEEEWDTVGISVSVSFYRRSLAELCNAVTSSGLLISKISEGEVDEKVKEMCSSTYERLKQNPNFIFIRCEKPNE